MAAHPWGTLCPGAGGWGDVVGAVAFARLVRVTAVNSLICREPCLHSCSHSDIKYRSGSKLLLLKRGQSQHLNNLTTGNSEITVLVEGVCLFST